MIFPIPRWGDLGEGSALNYTILLENQKKRVNLSLGLLTCFSMFVFWQMGFIYYMGPSLTIDGRTPLPISMDNITLLIAAGYVLSILWMIFLPHLVVYAERFAAITALLSVAALFLPLPEEGLRFLIYTQAFCCCFMIGFETFLITNFFSELAAIKHLTVAYGIALLLIAAVQNDFVPVTFPQFRLSTILALALQIYFYFRLPGSKAACPRYVKKSDGMIAPRKLLTGTFLLVFIGSLMGVSAPAIAGEVKHGVFLMYSVEAVTSVLIYFLYRKKKIHPFRSISICIGLGCIGFLLMFAGTHVPVLTYPACGLIGFGMVTCMMLPLYNLVMMKTYPSRYLPPVTIGLALVAVLVQSSMVELFRQAPTLLYLAYAVIMVILALLYLQMEPYLLNTLHRKVREPLKQKEETGAVVQESNGKHDITGDDTKNPLSMLSKREREVADLIGYGYSNGDIAKVLFISEHTVKDHTKNIYRKADVHSRLELAALVNKWKTRETETEN